MSKAAALQRRVWLMISSGILAIAVVLPLFSTPAASAAQVTNRSIAISSSKVSATSVTYSVSFKAVSASVIKGIVIDLCQDSPLIGTTCDRTNGVAATPNSSTITVSNASGSPASLAYTVATTGTGVGSGLIKLTDSGGITPSVGNAITFSFTATNPSGTIATPGAPGTFYGRIITYTATATALAYDSSSTGVNNPGTHLDEGGVAMSTANQLTVNARVQEQLQFCVGATTVDDAVTSVATSCTSGFPSATTVDLGVVDGSAVVFSPTSTNGGNGLTGVAMVRTNAFNGATVSYYAEANGTNHTGALRVSGATCAVGASNTDQCFNSIGTTQTTIPASTEDFGMTIAGVNCVSTTAYTCLFTGGTYNLTRNSNYDGDGANTYGSSQGYAWDESGTAQQIASSSTVIDDEALILRFAAQASITTPTGQYGVTSTYVATATF